MIFFSFLLSEYLVKDQIPNYLKKKVWFTENQFPKSLVKYNPILDEKEKQGH